MNVQLVLLIVPSIQLVSIETTGTIVNVMTDLNLKMINVYVSVHPSYTHSIVN